MAKGESMATVTVKMDNPGDTFTFKPDDKTFLKLFTDVAECKGSVERLWVVTIAGFTGIAGLLAGVIGVLVAA